jgi:Ca2+-binding RTX toxin-like protein
VPRFVATNNPIDMRAGSFEALTDSEVLEHSSTMVSLWNAVEQEQYIFTGSFGSFDGDGVPHSGTITGFTMYSDGALTITGSQLSFPVASFVSYVQSGNFQGFLDVLLAGNDTIIGDNVNGVAGNADYLTGGGGDDVISGLNGNDQMFGGAGFDTIYPGFGADYVDGGPDVDTVSFSNYGSIGITYVTGSSSVAPGQTITMVNVEQVQGTKFADTMTLGGGGAYTLLGFDGNDKLYAGANGGNLLGENGDDELHASPASDSFRGGAGVDGVYYSDAASAVTVDLSILINQNTGGSGFDSFPGNDIEDVFGSEFGDRITGSSLNNDLFGMNGNDVIEGRGGDDFLYGGGGTDTVSFLNAPQAVKVNLATGAATGDGADTFSGFEAVQGSNFDDELTGSSGNDGFFGGKGNDKIVDASTTDRDVVTYSGIFSQYSVTWDGTVVKVADRTSGRDGVDTLKGIEVLRFSDGTELDLSTMERGSQQTATLPLDTESYLLRDPKAPLVLYYYFAGGGADVGGKSTSRAWTSIEQQQMTLALSRYEAVANIVFQQTTNRDVANFIFGMTQGANLPASGGEGQTAGMAFLPGTAKAGEAVFNADLFNALSILPGSYMFENFVHEIGHLLGMTHPWEQQGASIPQPQTWGFNNTIYTIESYTNPRFYNVGSAAESAYPDGPMPLDINLLQTIYGANPTTRGGDDSYNLQRPSMSALYDTGGVDTIFYNGSGNARIDLRDLPLDASLASKNIGISFAMALPGGGLIVPHGIAIENAKGGAGNDVIFGNALSNRLEGGLGRDVVVLDAHSASVQITRNPDGSVSVAGAGIGTDTLIGVEAIRFNDRDLVLNAQTPLTKDYNGDGGSDVLWRNANGEIYVWNSQQVGQGSFLGQSLGLADNAWKVQSTGDYNGDGRADVLFRNSSTGEIYVWASPIGGSAQQKTVSTTAALSSDGETHASTPSVSFVGQGLGAIDLSWTIQPGGGDFNGDGRADVLWRNVSGEVYVWNSNPTSDVNMTGQSLGFVSNAWKIVTVGDFNGDGRADVLWRHTNGDVYVWNSSASGPVTMTGQSISYVDTVWKIVGIGDFNGDGRDDILWRHDNGEVYVWNSNTNADVSFLGQSLGFVPTGWQIADIGDLNGDGRSDVLWRGPAGEVYAWNSHASGAVAFDGQGLGTTALDWQILTDGHP